MSLRRNPDHRRSPLVHLADEGRTIVDELFRRSEASRTALLADADLSTDELREARRVLRALVASFGR